MRETMLGRWVVRVACAMGVGAAVLGLPAAANAADASQTGAVVFYELPGQITSVGTVDGTKTPVFTTNDVIWN